MEYIVVPVTAPCLSPCVFHRVSLAVSLTLYPPPL
jgi:hypothetical protein